MASKVKDTEIIVLLPEHSDVITVWNLDTLPDLPEFLKINMGRGWPFNLYKNKHGKTELTVCEAPPHYKFFDPANPSEPKVLEGKLKSAGYSPVKGPFRSENMAGIDFVCWGREIPPTNPLRLFSPAALESKLAYIRKYAYSKSASNDAVSSAHAFTRPKGIMTVMPLGLGSGLSNKPNTCFVMELDNGARYYIDFPRNMYDAGDLFKVQNVVLTHNDPDHEGDLVRLLQEKTFGAHKGKISLITTKDIFNKFLAKLPQLELGKTINPVFVRPGEHYKNESGLELEIRDNLHGDLPTIGLKLAYKGKKLGYSSDIKYPGERELNQWASLHSFEAIRDKKFGCLNEVLDHISRNEYFTDFGQSELVYFIEANISRLIKEIDAEKEGAESYPCRRKICDNLDSNGLWEYINKPIRGRMKNWSPLWFSDCDVILHEAWDDENLVHTNVNYLDALPDELCNKMYLVHTPDNFIAPHDLRVMETGRKYRI